MTLFLHFTSQCGFQFEQICVDSVQKISIFLLVLTVALFLLLFLLVDLNPQGLTRLINTVKACVDILMIDIIGIGHHQGDTRPI